LVIGANIAKGANAPDFAATRIYTVPSQMMPVNVQRGIGGPAGGPPGLTPPLIPGQNQNQNQNGNRGANSSPFNQKGPP
jgi:hypothetical protein